MDGSGDLVIARDLVIENLINPTPNGV